MVSSNYLQNSLFAVEVSAPHHHWLVGQYLLVRSKSNQQGIVVADQEELPRGTETTSTSLFGQNRME